MYFSCSFYTSHILINIFPVWRSPYDKHHTSLLPTRFGGESEQLDMLHRGSTDGHYPRLPEALQQLQVVSLGSLDLYNPKDWKKKWRVRTQNKIFFVGGGRCIKDVCFQRMLWNLKKVLLNFCIPRFFLWHVLSSKQILECNKHVSCGNYPTWLSGSFLYNDWAWEMRISHLIGLDLGFWWEVFSAFLGDQVHHDLWYGGYKIGTKGIYLMLIHYYMGASKISFKKPL